MKVRLTRNAQAELTTILNYLDQYRPSAAANALAAIENGLETIARQPRSGLATDHPEIRVKLVVKFSYKIFYRIVAGQIQVVHIRHGARNPWEGQRQ